MAAGSTPTATQVAASNFSAASHTQLGGYSAPFRWASKDAKTHKRIGSGSLSRPLTTGAEGAGRRTFQAHPHQELPHQQSQTAAPDWKKDRLSGTLLETELGAP